MGCESSRDHHPEDAIETNERVLGISQLTVSQVLQAFFNLNTKEEIEEKKVKKALEVLNINVSEQDDKLLLGPFLALFENKNESDPEAPKLYNFPALLTALILMTKSKTTEKAKAIFRVFDHECTGSLDKATSEVILRSIFNVVRKYSELFSELDSFKIAAQSAKVTDSINGLVTNRLKILLGDGENLSEENFISRWGKLDKSEEEQALAPADFMDADYKEDFLRTTWRSTKSLKTTHSQSTNSLVTKKEAPKLGLLTRTDAVNDVWNRTSYQTPEWQTYLYQSFYKKDHNIKQFKMNEKLNPEVVEKPNNMRRTRITEYGNALHNQRVKIVLKFLTSRYSSTLNLPVAEDR